MIWNPGELPPQWTIEKLMGKHASVPYNPDMANAFFRAGLIESWGRGIERIVEACHDAGTPEPVIQQEPGGLWVEFPFAEVDISTGQVTGQVQKLISVIQGEQSSSELMAILESKHRDSFTENYLKPALEAGFIEMTIPDKPKSRLQKYRLTENGERHRQ